MKIRLLLLLLLISVTPFLAAQLPPSGTISISDLRTEFGGLTPDAISEYYNGAGLVPNIPANSGVPTSGPISLSDFYSASQQSISLTGGTIYSCTTGPDAAFSSANFRSGGGIDESSPVENGDCSSSDDTGGTWATPLTPSGHIDAYIYAQLTSGTTPTSNAGLDTCLSITSGGRTWGNLRLSSSAGTTTSTVLFSIHLLDDCSDDAQTSASYVFNATAM